MAQPKIEILVSLLKTQAEKQAKELGSSIERAMGNVASTLISAQMFKKMFSQAAQYAQAFFDNALKNSEDLKAAVEQLEGTWAAVGKRFGDTLAASKEFGGFLAVINQRLTEFGAFATDLARGGAVIKWFTQIASIANVIGDTMADWKDRGQSAAMGVNFSKLNVSAGRQNAIDTGVRFPQAEQAKRLLEQAKKLERAKAEAAKQAKKESRLATGKTGDLVMPEEFGGGFDSSSTGREEIARENAEKIAEINNENMRAKQEEAEELAQINSDSLKAQQEHVKEQESIRKQAQESYLQDNQAWIGITQQGVSGITSGMASVIAAAASGQADLGDIMAKAAGGMLVSVGQTLMSLGTAAVLAGTLGTIVPFLLPVTGGPAGVAAGFAAIAGGALLVATGSALGAVGQAGKKAAAGQAALKKIDFQAKAPGGATGSSNPSISNVNRTETQGTGGTNQVINVTFEQGFAVGSKPRLARELTDLLAAASR